MKKPKICKECMKKRLSLDIVSINNCENCTVKNKNIIQDKNFKFEKVSSQELEKKRVKIYKQIL